MTKMNYAEVMDAVQYYENDSELKDLHAESRNAWEPLFNRSHVVKLPDHYTRGLTVDMPSPRLRDLRASLISTMGSYRSIATVHPQTEGSVSSELERKADKVERALAVIRQHWSDGGKLQDDRLHQQLLGPCFIAILQCGDVRDTGSAPPWTVLRPDPTSCYFPVSGSPDRPKYMARRYMQLVREIEASHSNRPGTEHYGANLRKRSGVWRWEPLGADRSVEDPSSAPVGGSAKYGEQNEFIWFDDGEYIYRIAMNDDKKKGEIVWCGKNLTGGGSSLVVCGDPSPSRETKNMLTPALISNIQLTLQINLIRSMRATAALQSKPDMTVEMTPEAFAVARDGGYLQQSLEVEQGANLIHVEGKAVPWVVRENLDLDKLEERLLTEEAEYIAAWKEPTDPKTVSDARANTYLTAVEAIRLRQTTLLKHGDWLETQLCKMALHSLKNEYKTEISLYATGPALLSSGEMPAGGGVTLGPADLDFDYDVVVTTKAQTESEQRAREEHGVWRRDQGIDTQESIIELSYVDKSAQLERLAKDMGYKVAQPQVNAAVYAAWRDILRIEAGYLLPETAEQLMATMQPGAAAVSAGQSPMMPAAIGSPEGGAM